MSVSQDVASHAVVKRRVAAPCEGVLQAWTKAEYLQRCAKLYISLDRWA